MTCRCVCFCFYGNLNNKLKEEKKRRAEAWRWRLLSLDAYMWIIIIRFIAKRGLLRAIHKMNLLLFCIIMSKSFVLFSCIFRAGFSIDKKR